MLRLLYPDLYVNSLSEINLESLNDRGIQGVIIDIDNTIVEWGSETIRPDVKLWFAKAEELNFKMCMLSNGFKGRVDSISRAVGVPAVRGFLKPAKGAFRKALEVLGTSPQETAVIGDQVFTDVLGGNLMGLYTILVTPLCKREFFTTKLVRMVEKVALRLLKGRHRPYT